ncbi:MAG: hypothetical protein EZS28_033220, partial [Streblomastix strix]
VKSLLESETMQLVGMIEKSKEQKGSEQEKEQMNKRMNELETKVRSLEVEKESEKQEKVKEKRDKEKALAEKDQEKRRADLAVTEKDRLQVELNRERTEKYQEKRRADSAQIELNRERTEKERAQVEKDSEKRRADSAQVEVTRLTTEIARLNQELLRREAVKTPKAKQTLLQVTSSAQAITVNLQVPSGMRGQKDANRFTHDDYTDADCTILTYPIISEGIVYYESVFEKHENWSFEIGIADSSVVFKPNKEPDEDEYSGKTVNYWSGGRLVHINDCTHNQRFVCGQRIGAEVNITCRPRRLTFFVDDVEQQYYVLSIPEAIRFWSLISEPNSLFTVTRFERRSSSSAHGVTGSIGLEWGKRW